MPIDDRIRDGLQLNAEQPSPPVEQHLDAVLHRGRRRARVRSAAVAGALALLVGVPVAVHQSGSEPPSPPVAGRPSYGELPTALRGTWMVRTTRQQVRADLRRSGLGDYADRFIAAERFERGRVDLAVTYSARRFQVRWRQPDGTWYAGWYGNAEESGGVVVMTDDLDQADNSYRWSVEGRQLTLRFVSTTTPDQQGIPFEATSRAYFTRPLQGVDCAPPDLDPCL